ncbi:mariner Mos1 transposase [Trichonephila clavipes]|nr:mariner Mos1 transposase [Trichonephila clavipes]
MRFTITTFSLKFYDVYRSVVYKIVTEDLNFKKLCSRWILTAEHEEKRFAISLNFLIRYEEKGNDLLSRIVTGNETWVSISPWNQNNSQWNGDTHPLPSRSKPNKRCQSSRLWKQCSGTGVVFCWWTSCHKEQGSTQVPTVPLYGSFEGQCKIKARHAVKRFFLLHDNVRPHTSRTTRELIESFGWVVLDHAPYSPDVAPGDFHIFRYLKHSLCGKHFSDNEEVKATVNSWLSDQAADFFDESFQNLVLRYDKCINELSNYVEK